MFPDYLTPSKINTFNQCPFKYWAHYIARQPQICTDGRAARFGSAVHNIVVLYYDKIDNDSNLKEVSEKMEEAFVEGADWRTDNFKTRLKKVQRNLKAFEVERLDKGWNKPTLLEKRLKAEFYPDMPPFEGIVDAYFEDQKMAVDWKTGKYEEMDTSRMVQGKIYQMLLDANGYPTEKILFNNLTLGRRLTLPRITEGWVENVVRQMLQMIKNERFPKRSSGLCNGWCGYALSCAFNKTCPWSDV